MSGTYLYVASGAFAAGVAVALLTPISYVFAFLMLALGIAPLFFKKRFQLAVVVAMLCIGFGFGVMRTINVLQRLDTQTLPNYIGTKVALVGRVAEDPAASDIVRVVLDDISIDGEEVSGKSLVTLPADVSVSYGDQLYVQGKLKAPEAFETTSGHTFDYPNYLRSQGIQAQMSFAKLLDRKQAGWSFTRSNICLSIHSIDYCRSLIMRCYKESL